MRAMVLRRQGEPLELAELPEPKLPLVLGHQVVGVVAKLGAGAATCKRRRCSALA